MMHTITAPKYSTNKLLYLGLRHCLFIFPIKSSFVNSGYDLYIMVKLFAKKGEKLSLKRQSYPESPKLDAFVQENMQCHSPSYNVSICEVSPCEILSKRFLCLKLPQLHQCVSFYIIIHANYWGKRAAVGASFFGVLQGSPVRWVGTHVMCSWYTCTNTQPTWQLSAKSLTN